MGTVVALVAGLVFGVGLTISQMVNPAKVLDFLDFGGIPAGAWDPSLAFVMAGAFIVAAPAFHLAGKRGRPLLDGPLRIPAGRDIDRPLVIGGLLFGLGWGLVGFCPGPAISALAFGAPEAFIFFAAMVGGMVLHQLAVAPKA